jgi:hypothetical protein
MKTVAFIPNSLRTAGRELRIGFRGTLEKMSQEEFVRTWSAVAYLFPGLHPDGYEDSESGWPGALKRFAGEAWRRAEAGELADDELYCSDAQWCGLYDRMHTHEPDETERRFALAASSRQSSHA